MCTVGTAERGVECHRVAIVANGGVVFFDPRNPQYNVVGSWGNVEAYGFFIAGDAKDEGIEVGDVAALGGTSVGKDEGYRSGFDKARESVASENCEFMHICLRCERTRLTGNQLRPATGPVSFDPSCPSRTSPCTPWGATSRYTCQPGVMRS